MCAAIPRKAWDALVAKNPEYGNHFIRDLDGDTVHVDSYVRDAENRLTRISDLAEEALRETEQPIPLPDRLDFTPVRVR